jgi:hypothetical protein
MAASLDQFCRLITEDHAPVWTDLGESDEAEQSIATTDIEEHFSILQSRAAQYPIADSFELSYVVAGDGLITTESLINQ